MFLATHGVLRRSSAFVPPVFADTYSFEYDGVSDYLDVGDVTELNNSSNFCASFWFKYTGTLSGTKNIMLSGGSASNNDFYIQPTNATTIRYQVASANTNFIVTSMTQNTWIHLFLAHVGTTVTLYMNGVSQGSATRTLPTSIGTGFSIGRYSLLGGIYYFQGNIDEVAVWNTDQSTNVSTIYGSGVPTDISSLNPVGHWRAENATFDGSNWNITDSGSGGNNATSVSMTSASRSTDVPLFDNKSFEYDGVSDYLEGTTTYSELDGVSKASFSMWLKPETGGTTLRTVFQIGDGSASDVNGVCQLFLFENSRIDFSVDSGTFFGRADISGVTYGSWNHLLITVDFDADPEFKCYVNGVDATTSDNMSTKTAFTNATQGLMIGEWHTGKYAPFLGGIDEFAIWSGVALTSTDVASIYNSGVPNNLNDSSIVTTAPTTWLRADSSTWDGSKWTVDDENSSYQLESNNMTSASRTSDVPT